MTKKLRAIILSLMVVFSLSLIIWYQKTIEQSGEVKEEATETKEEIKEKAAEIAREIKDEAAESLKQDKEKAAETSREIKGEAAESLKQDKEKAAETAREIKDKAAEPHEQAKERAAETAGEIKEEARENVIEITITGAKESAAETPQDTEGEWPEEITGYEEEPPEDTGPVPAPILIAEPDYRVTDSTVRVTLEWYPVYHENPVTYFLRLYCENEYEYRAGWISGTKWTREISTSCFYSWNVKARDDVGHKESAWSSTDSFIVEVID